jgi:hypothetical protein
MVEDRNGTDGAVDGAAKDAGTPAEGRGLGSVLYKVGLAGVGALILAQEEIEAAWRRARGEKGEGAGDAPAPAPAQTKTGDTAETKPDGTRVSAQIDGAIGRVLRSLSIPTRDEVTAVEARIDALMAKLDDRDQRRK